MLSCHLGGGVGHEGIDLGGELETLSISAVEIDQLRPLQSLYNVGRCAARGWQDRGRKICTTASDMDDRRGRVGARAYMRVKLWCSGEPHILRSAANDPR